MNKKIVKKYDDIVFSGSMSVSDLCYKLYQMLKSEKEPASIFEYLCKNISEEDVNFKEKSILLSRNKIDQYKNLYGKFIDTVINIARVKADTDPSCNFYVFLWNNVFENSILNNDDEKAFAFYWILIDRRIPYLPTEKPLVIEKKEIEHILESSKDIINSIYYIFELPLATKTETASLLLKELLKVEDFKKQVVLLVKILNISDEYNNQSIKKLLKLINNRNK